jgi:DNA-binding response OmpR family regulator
MYLTSDAQVRNILIVDDSAFEQRMLVDLLSELPYRVSVAFNGEQGYQLAISGLPDLILLDIRMPNMDGYTCCRLLKANPATRDIPIIFLSGTEAAEDRITGLQIGGVDFVSKPFTPGELAARIHVHLNLMKRPARQAADTEPADTDSVIVNAAKRLIYDNLAALPGLADIAASVGTYREKLNQLFRTHTGMTVFAYIREARIERAAHLLRDTDMEVQDIALLLGFANAGNFATAFRERMGSTPSNYRASIVKTCD